jgi:Ice-binding-like
MNRFENITKPLRWLMALLLVAVVAGCGGGDGIPSTGPGAVCTDAGCVDLGTAANYVILDEATVTFTPIATASTTPTITGNIGLSPAAASFITGFALALDPAKCFSTSTHVTGKIYAANYSSVNGCATATTDTATILTKAVGDKQLAYGLAAGKTKATDAAHLNLLAGVIPNNHDFAPGIYTWDSGTPSGNVGMTGKITLTGTSTDVWIFQISGNLNLASSANITLVGALPQNVFWQVASGVSIGAGAHMEGVVLSATNIALVTGATAKGRLLARTGVLMDSNTVTQP